MYSLPRYSNIELGPSSLRASSKAFLKFVLNFGKPDVLATLKIDVPVSSICLFRLATSDLRIAV